MSLRLWSSIAASSCQDSLQLDFLPTRWKYGGMNGSMTGISGGGGWCGAREVQMDRCFVLKPAWEIADMIQNRGRFADTALHWALRS